MRNIVLIGMPGCGKTTIGKKIAEILKKEFYDSDDYIEEKNRMTIKEIFGVYGEKYFRDLESRAAVELSKLCGAVIATGGGLVERSENIDALKENGIIVFVNRSVEDISKDVDISGRPLLADGTARLNALYERRFPLYKSSCDIEVENSGEIKMVVQKIIDEVMNNYGEKY